MESVTAPSNPAMGSPLVPEPPLRIFIRMAGLAAVIGNVIPEAKLGQPGHHPGALVLLIVVVVSWLGWLKARDMGHAPLTALSLLVLAVAGGALTPLAPIAIAVGAVVGAGTAGAFSLPVALALGAAGPAASLVSGALTGRSLLISAAFGAAELGGMVIGVSRRQTQFRVEQQALVDLERERAELEHERAELLGERNRLAREIHDVLAHTLGAVSVQIEALDSMIGREDDVALHARLQGTRGLVVQGLDEARRAVAALRDDAPPLPQQLEELCAGGEAALKIDGEPRSLTAPVSLALFRIAQEALTNAGKHAPGAAVTVALRFGAGAVELDVRNGAPTGAPAAAANHGGGYGLQGMRERVLLLGGTLNAEPAGQGWLVEAALPA